MAASTVARAVLDASALLAYLFDEPGTRVVIDALGQGVIMSAVNVAEVLTKLVERGVSAGEALSRLGSMGLLEAIELIDFGLADAREVAQLRQSTADLGLSLGDRACLALARQTGLPVLTSDRQWASLQEFDIRCIR